ncbi:MAG: carbon-nitrogen hydrolase family protein [Tissierellia bacterium]|nr:carbon-nitrogen hydrolase family protein [Tissierellia bacterium]
MKFNLALIQMKVHSEKEECMKIAENHISEAVKQGANVVLLPEMFCCPYQASLFPSYAEEEGGYVYEELRALAIKYNIYICGGTMPEKDAQGKIYNTSYVFNPQGEQIAKHRKVHLFDVNVKGGQYFMESDTLTAGDSFTVFDTEYGKMGLCICYDMRFPELARLMNMAGAEIILTPAAFNMTTGPLHWELLFRQRGVDNQVFTAGCSPARDLEGPYTSWGNSIIASPWGKIVGQLDEKEGILVQEIDLEEVKNVREQLPLLKHMRKDLYHLEYTGE